MIETTGGVAAAAETGAATQADSSMECIQNAKATKLDGKAAPLEELQMASQLRLAFLRLLNALATKPNAVTCSLSASHAIRANVAFAMGCACTYAGFL